MRTSHAQRRGPIFTKIALAINSAISSPGNTSSDSAHLQGYLGGPRGSGGAR